MKQLNWRKLKLFYVKLDKKHHVIRLKLNVPTYDSIIAHDAIETGMCKRDNCELIIQSVIILFGQIILS